MATPYELVQVTESAEVHSIHWEPSGDDTGKALFLAHGAGFNADAWHDLSYGSFFASRGLDTYAVDLSGADFGRSRTALTDETASASDVFLEFIDVAIGGDDEVEVSAVFPSLSGPKVGFEAILSDVLDKAVFISPVGVEDFIGLYSSPFESPETLVVWGEQDELAPVANAKRLADEFVSADVYIDPDAEHALYTFKPSSLRQRILDHIQPLSEEDQW